MDTVLQVESHKTRVEGDNHPGGASFGAIQDLVDFLDCKCTMPSHVELFIHKYPQVCLSRASLDPFSTKPVLVLLFSQPRCRILQCSNP